MVMDIVNIVEEIFIEIEGRKREVKELLLVVDIMEGMDKIGER